MIKFYVLRTYIWGYHQQQGSSSFDDYEQYETSLLQFAKENNCIIDEHYSNIFECTEEDYIILKLKHPRVFKYSDKFYS